MPSVLYTPAPSAVNHASSSPIFFTPLTIVVLILMIVFIVILLGSMVIFSYRRYIRSNQSSLALADDAVDLQANNTAHSNVDYTNGKASLWTAFWNWVSPPTEPELPWHVYAVVPATRPKGPIHLRALKPLMLWKKDEYKREPFTVADVRRAMEEIEARTAARAASPEKPSVWRRFIHLFKHARVVVEVPNIVVHPCDGTPAFTYISDSARTSLVLSPTSAKFRIDAFPCTAPSSEHSTPSTVSPDYSPASTASEPDSPPLVTPTMPGLEVPMPSSTAPREVQEKNEDAINVSNFSGEQFVLAVPPLKHKRQIDSKVDNDSENATSIGLGLGPVLHSQSSISSDLTDIFEDASDEIRPTASEGSVSDLMTILDAYTAEYPTVESFKDAASLSTSPSGDSTVLEPSTKRYACLIEALSISFSRSTLDSPNSSLRSSGESSDYGYGDVDHKGNDYASDDGKCDGYDSDASGNTDYYECSVESSFGLDEEEEKQREAFAAIEELIAYAV